MPWLSRPRTGPAAPPRQEQDGLGAGDAAVRHHEAGLTTGDPDEAARQRTLAGRAADTWVLASREKIGAASPFTVLALEAVSAVFTDAAEDTLSHLRRAGVGVLQA